MKFFKTLLCAALMLAFISTSTCMPRYARVFGNIFKEATKKFQYIDTLTAKAQRFPLESHRVIVKFPQDSIVQAEDEYIIRGVQTADYALEPSDIEIIDGGIGEKSITFAVTSQKEVGMGTALHIYGEPVGKVEEKKPIETVEKVWPPLNTKVEEKEEEEEDIRPHKPMILLNHELKPSNQKQVEEDDDIKPHRPNV